MLQAMKLVGTLALGFLVQEGCGEAVELIEANFHELVRAGGRNAFVKFHAPWCGHCRSLAPTWDKLAEFYKDSKTVLIGDVDCTSDGGKPLCDWFNHSSYPTLRYFRRDTGETGDQYHFGRGYETLDEWVKTELHQITWCDAKTKEHCSDQQVAYISEVQGKTKDEWSAELDRLNELKQYGTPYKANQEYIGCDVIDPGPFCNPMQTPELEPKKAFQCCNLLGQSCRGFLYVSSAAQKARDGDDKASVYFCNGAGDWISGAQDAMSAVGYVKYAPEDELPDTTREAKTWLMQRIEMLESLLEDPTSVTTQKHEDKKDEL